MPYIYSAEKPDGSRKFFVKKKEALSWSSPEDTIIKHETIKPSLEWIVGYLGDIGGTYRGWHISEEVIREGKQP